MLSDIEIAQNAKMLKIKDIAKELGIDEEELIPYGHYKAKLSEKLFADTADKPDGKLILVTAINPTPAGEGKTTTSVGLADALCALGKKTMLCLREPSLGPVFGVKGGAAGGGYSQVLPMESINLHFTGDFHAIGAANNLIAAMIDNARHFRQVDLREVTWRRVVDLNDRQLRFIVTGLGGPVNGDPAETGFDITVASELMAVLCLSDSEEDLRRRIDNLVLGYKFDKTPFTCKELGATGAVMALLLEAVKPNLVQTTEGTPAFVHGGPFANIAHGCNSVAATKAAMTLGEYAITEAGFGSDLGAQKFFDIKCRHAHLTPSAVVLVTSLKALRWHGGVDLKEIGKPNLEALKAGLCNLDAHVANLKHFGPGIVVSMNHFAGDPEEEIAVLREHCQKLGVRFAVSRGFAEGGKGAEDLAREVLAICEEPARPLSFTYPIDAPIVEKITAVAQKVYGAGAVSLSEAAKKDLKAIEELGFDRLDVCLAKTPLSMTHDAAIKGAPKGWTLPVARLILNAGAGFIVATTGSILRMPGLPRSPAALKIDVKDGKITGLS